ncbi:MAG: hypothetical protein JWQ38_1132 [Flavipsychrobacter sp.]|nr:hypothetical protein [Flavipsychrobacter sp.]
MNTINILRKTKMILAGMVLFAAFSLNATAQDNTKIVVKKQHGGEQFGNTLNLGLGLGYYGYFGQTAPLFSVNYEINVARNFTLAPSVGIASFRSDRFYDYAGHHYYYHRTIVPIALKGTYYFDELLGAGPNWDFYLGASLGFVYSRTVWDDGYYGTYTAAGGTSRLYLDGHIGTEYHFNRKLGLFLDLSSGISTIGLAIHHL